MSLNPEKASFLHEYGMRVGWSEWPPDGRLGSATAAILFSLSRSFSLSNQLNEAGGMDCGSSSSDHAVLRCAFNLPPSAIGSIISHPGKTTAMRLWAVHVLCPPEMVNLCLNPICSCISTKLRSRLHPENFASLIMHNTHRTMCSISKPWICNVHLLFLICPATTPLSRWRVALSLM